VRGGLQHSVVEGDATGEAVAGMGADDVVEEVNVNEVCMHISIISSESIASMS
jgi:hypothetical protein